MIITNNSCDISIGWVQAFVLSLSSHLNLFLMDPTTSGKSAKSSLTYHWAGLIVIFVTNIGKFISLFVPAAALTCWDFVSVGRATFDQLVQILEWNPIFQSSGRKPQQPIRYQLGCFLIHYWTHGANPLQAGHKLGVGFGTVFLYCRCVVRALQELGMQVITWGDKDRRNKTTQCVMDHSGIPGCVGMLDSSLLCLSEMLDHYGLTFICWKKYPTVNAYYNVLLSDSLDTQINVQAIVDHEKWFIAVELGWPGSVSDIIMWKKSHIW